MNKKTIIKMIITIGLLAIIVIFSFIAIFKHKEKTYSNFSEYVNDYKDAVIEVSGDNIYSNEFILKDKVLSSNDKDVILPNVIKVHSIYYKNDNYIYLVLENGNTYYLNNIKGSTQDKYELTLLDDYHELIKIESNNDNIIGVDVKGNIYGLSDKMDTYIGYSRQED